jgi:thymidylate synthase (FAD)
MSDLHEDTAALLAEAKTPTRRPTVAALEEKLFRPVHVLDHGFVRVIDYMGDDAAIVQAARVSYGKGTKSQRNDRGLIRYLMRHRHTTPMEMCEIKLHVKLPIFVARQWIRHRTANVNEYSARYSILDREFYIPEPGQLAEQSNSNRQGREQPLSSEQAQAVRDILRRDAMTCYDTYTNMINDDGTGEKIDPNAPQVARELARINLGAGYYTQWYWKTDLHNLFHFLSLRAHSHAQYEIQVYAEAIAEMTKLWVPMAFEAFEDYRMGAAHFSTDEVKILRAALDGVSLREFLKGSDLSAREVNEFRKKLGKI